MRHARESYAYSTLPLKPYVRIGFVMQLLPAQTNKTVEIEQDVPPCVSFGQGATCWVARLGKQQGIQSFFFWIKKAKKMISSPNPAPVLSELPPSMKKVVMRAPRRICVVCSKTTSLRCSTCKVTFYCSVECRDVDWTSHAKECSSYLQEEGSLLPYARLLVT